MIMHLSPMETMLWIRHDRSRLPAPTVTASPIDVLAGIPVEAACLHSWNAHCLPNIHKNVKARQQHYSCKCVDMHRKLLPKEDASVQRSIMRDMKCRKSTLQRV